MEPLIIYHAGCADGFCAAWVVRPWYTDAEFRPMNYSDEPPTDAEVAGREVLILDFSFPREVMLRLHAAAKSLRCLDHHKTAQEVLAGLDFCTFDLTKSGARLAWEMVNGGREPPWLVKYTEDRDLWKWELENSKEINAALRCYPFDFDGWDELGRTGYPRRLIEEGRAILRYQDEVIAGAVENAAICTIAGYRVPVVNSTTLISEIAGKLAEGHPFGVCWFEKADGTRIYSLRSREGGEDVSAIARQFGGGGHKHAAGFSVAPVVKP